MALRLLSPAAHRKPAAAEGFTCCAVPLVQHYIHTLLAAKGLADQTSCRVEGVAATDWSKGGEHPKSYGWATLRAGTAGELLPGWQYRGWAQPSM